MERTTISVLCPPKWTFTMSHMVYKATETTISRAEEIKTWYICICRWCLSSRWHQGKLHHDYCRYCQTIKIFGVYRSCRKIAFFTNPELEILGFTINSINMMVRLKKEKKEQLACLIRKTNKKFIKIRKLARTIGKIVAALPGYRFVALCYSWLDKNKQYGLQKSKYNYEAYVELFQESITKLTWWQENLPNMLNKISEDPPTTSIVMHQTLVGEHIFRVELQGVTGHLKKNIII